MSDRAISILIALVVLAVMGTLGVRYYMNRDLTTQTVKTAPPKKEKPRTSVEVRVTQCERKNDRTGSSGFIENTGNVDLHYVTVNAIWKDANGLVIETDRIYALNNGKLEPGQRKKFQAFTTLPAAKCNAEAVDWW